MMRCHFGKDFKNGIAGWHFTEEVIDEAYRHSGILMLDMEFGIKCTLDCHYCFRTNDRRDTYREKPVPLTLGDVNDIVDQAAKMGARSIHFVGKGEPLEEKAFLSIVHHVGKKGMIPLIFTAGHVLGDDRLAMDIHEMKGDDIAKDLYDSKASVILKINSLNHEIQNDVVQKPTIRYKDGNSHAFNYTKFRDIAFERLIEAGFNREEHNPTRLGTATVMLKSNYHELFHHYRYFRCLNVYPIINTVVPCGRTEDMAEVENISPTEEEKLELWKKIYSFNIENGIKYEGVSSYVGGHICSQLGYALYINVFGEVFDCPSSTRKPIGNIKINHNEGEKLVELWKKSPNRKRYHGCKDNGCPWRFKHPAMISRSLFRNVHEYLKMKYPNDESVRGFVPPKYYY
jgi:MoaA/NifB/PqqE/SkfB family radical SAM enzyme